MRTLSRPMFNMGGPIKEGVMHGIREPYKGGGAALVGDPRFPKDATGRAHHYTWIPQALATARTGLAALPKVWRGLKAGRTFTPGKLGAWNRFKSMLGPSGRFKNLAEATGKHGTKLTPAPLRFKEWATSPFHIGKAIRENPITFGTSLTLPATGIDLGREHGKDIAKGGWNLAKRFGAAVVPGDQSHWYTDPDPATDVPLSPNIQKKIAAAKELSKKKKEEFALQQREDRVQKYLKMMGYDRAKKTAIADALIDASKIVGDRGTLDLRNIGQEMINPIIQATSKRLDKPDQIREAVGLMATKAEIEKDLEDPTIKALRMEQYKQLKGGFEADIGDFILSAKGGKVKKEALEQFARVKAKEHGETFTVVDEGTTIPAEGGSGYYMIEDKIFKVVDGTPQQVV